MAMTDVACNPLTWGGLIIWLILSVIYTFDLHRRCDNKAIKSICERDKVL